MLVFGRPLADRLQDLDHLVGHKTGNNRHNRHPGERKRGKPSHPVEIHLPVVNEIGGQPCHAEIVEIVVSERPDQNPVDRRRLEHIGEGNHGGAGGFDLRRLDLTIVVANQRPPRNQPYQRPEPEDHEHLPPAEVLQQIIVVEEICKIHKSSLSKILNAPTITGSL